jgi:hypothetical protein
MPECNCKPFPSHFEFLHDDRSVAVLKDKGASTEYRYENKSKDHLSKYRIDGGLIASGAKCDYLLLNCEKKKAFFIELKGSDFIHAIEQIDKSIDVLKSDLPATFSIHARIVCTRANTINLRDTRFLKLERKVKKLGGDLEKQTTKLVEKG